MRGAMVRSSMNRRVCNSPWSGLALLAMLSGLPCAVAQEAATSPAAVAPNASSMADVPPTLERLASSLRAQAEALMPTGSDPEADIRRATKAEIRRLASGWLTSPESSALARRGRLGLIVARRLDEIDGWLDDERTPMPAIALLYRDLKAMEEADAAVDVEARLRDALAPAMQSLVTTGSGTRPASLTDDLNAWTTAALMPTDTIAALRKLDGLLVEADAWPAYRDTAESIRQDIRQVARASESLKAASSAPEGAPTAAPAETWRLAMLGHLARAAANLTGDGSSERRASTGRAWLRLARAHADLTPTLLGAQGVESQDVWRALLNRSASLGEADEVAAIEAALAAHDAAKSVLAKLDTRRQLLDEKNLVRPLRPVVRNLMTRSSIAGESAVLTYLAAGVRDRAFAERSEAREAFAALDRDIDDLRVLHRVSDIMGADGRPGTVREPGNRWTRICSKYLRASQDLLRSPDASQAARATIRSLSDQIVLASECEHARTLQPGDALGLRLMGDSRAMLASTLQQAHQAWLTTADREGEAPDAAALALLDLGAGLVRSAERLREFEVMLAEPTPERGRAMLGVMGASRSWGVDPAATAGLCKELVPRFQEAAALVASGQVEAREKARALIAALDRDTQVFGLATRLRRLAEKGSATATGQASASHANAIFECAGLGVLDRAIAMECASFERGVQDRLAEVAIGLQEWAGRASASAPAGDAESFRNNAGDAARKALELLDTIER